MPGLVDAVLLAEFDIDVGSKMSAQHPRDFVGPLADLQPVAELMLPDGSHKRDDDSTCFLWNRSPLQKPAHSFTSRRKVGDIPLNGPRDSSLFKAGIISDQQWSQHVDTLTGLLLQENLALAHAVWSATSEGNAAPMIGESLARLLGDSAYFESFFADRARAEQNSLEMLLTGSNQGSPAFKTLIRFAGHSFLLRTIQPCLMRIMEEGLPVHFYEINPSALPEDSSANIADNAVRVANHCTALLNAIHSSRAQCPASIQSMCRVVYNLATGTREQKISKVVAFFLSRYISDAMLHPIQAGLVAIEPSEGAWKVLAYAAASLRKIATGELFQDEYLSVLNGFVRQYIPLMFSYASAVLDDSDMVAETVPSSSSSGAPQALRCLDWCIRSQYDVVMHKLSARAVAADIQRLYHPSGANVMWVHCTAYCFPKTGGAEWCALGDGANHLAVLTQYHDSTMHGKLVLQIVHPGGSPLASILLGSTSRVSVIQEDFIAIEGLHENGGPSSLLALHVPRVSERHRFLEQLNSCVEGKDGSPKPILYCVSYMLQRVVDSARRGTRAKAIALVSSVPAVTCLKPLLVAAVESSFSANMTYDQLLSMLMGCISSIPFETRCDNVERAVMRWGPGSDFSVGCKQVAAMWGDRSIAISVPHLLEPYEFGQPALYQLIGTFREGIAALFVAMLDERRVLFIGKSCPVSVICNLVTAAAALVGAARPHVLHSTFPYAYLGDVEFLNVHGYIAGVANPVFESHMDWWDVLCDIDKGKVIWNRPGAQGALQDGSGGDLPPDSCHVPDLESTIASVLHLVHQRAPQDKILGLFNSSAVAVVDNFINFHRAANSSSFSDEVHISSKQSSVNAGWGHTLAAAAITQEAAKGESWMFGHVDFELRLQLERLRTGHGDQEAPLTEIARLVIDNRDNAMALARRLPIARGGLLPLTAFLLHDFARVRRTAGSILASLENYNIVNLSKTLDRFSLIAWRRVQTEMASSAASSATSEQYQM